MGSTTRRPDNADGLRQFYEGETARSKPPAAKPLATPGAISATVPYQPEEALYQLRPLHGLSGKTSQTTRSTGRLSGERMRKSNTATATIEEHQKPQPFRGAGFDEEPKIEN